MANSFKLGEEAEKTTCPYCKTPLKEGDDVVLCPSCQILHHADCWEENKGCSTFGCSEQHHEMQDTKPTNVCNNCGTTLSEEQAFCPKCGTPKSTPKDTNPMNVCTNCGTTLSNEQAFCPKCGTPKSNPRKKTCSKCGTELQDGQGFCPKCGQKTDLQMDTNTNSAISQYNSNVNKANKNNLIKFACIGGLIVAIIIIVMILVSPSGPKKFDEMYSKLESESWCEIASDGSWMKIDTNPYDIDDYYDSDAYHKIESINSELGFSSSVYKQMGETRALDGRQSASCDNYEVSWTYHPDQGMEVLYSIKN